MNVVVFHPGTQHSWQTATAIYELQRLEFFATSIFYKPDEWPYRIERYLPGALRDKVHREFRRFEHTALDPAKVRTVGLFEWLERMAGRAGLGKLAAELDRIGNRKFARILEQEIRSDRPFAMWGYNSSALESFQLAREHGRTCILDRTNGDFRIFNRLMTEVREEFPAYFEPEQERVEDWVIERDDAEYAAADQIVVGSEFARQTLEDGTGDAAVTAKTTVLNYCFDERLFAHLPPPAPVSRDEPVRFLFLGLLIPRKGIHLALEAISRFSPAQARLTLVGQMGIPRETFARFADRVDFIPTVARADVPAIMARHHVFMLPTYFEGAGIVLYEALAAGVAIIQSRNAALVATPDTGIMMDAIDVDSLHAAMLAVVDDRDRLNHYRANAQSEAQKYTFARYRQNIGEFLDRIVLG